jgi:hypothetical protein
MISKPLAAIAFSLGLLGASLAFAQTSGGSTGQGGGTSSPGAVNPDDTTTRSLSPDIEDLSSYLSGPHVRAFYRDDGLSALRPENEVRETFNAMGLDERMQLRAACAVNQNQKYVGLCRTVNALQ